LNRFVAESLASGPQAIAEFQLRYGSASRVQVVTEHLRNARDQPVGLLVLMNDVTQLRRLETIRSDFAANVSHELRTPITNIKGYVETMLDVGVRDQAQTRRFLEIINRNTARLASIIEDLLALARLEQPDMRSTLERVDIAVLRVIESALAQFEPDIKAKDMTTVVRVGGPAPHRLQVHANAQLLEQAISNLISNAIKYSPASTTITITAERLNSGDIAIGVADEGPGIPAEHRARIFERFYRVDRARSRELGGTGLGLAIVKHIALVHGGSVTVDSEVGRGSTFRITIPGRWA
jgi:two-component system phosphate regulon sensor histidine kinase PhoR